MNLVEAPHPAALRRAARTRPRGEIPLGRIADIEVTLNPSLLFIAALIVSSLGVHFIQRFPLVPEPYSWTAAVIATAAFFGSLLLHEVAHSLVAKSQGLHVQGISLFIFGGVSRMKGEPASAKNEFWMAAVGPLTSALLGGAFLGLEALLSGTLVPSAVAGWLGVVNLQLAVFNLLPGLPLDGGRILRAAVWAVTRDPRKATAWGLQGGSAIGHGLLFGGAIVLLAFGRLEGIWLGFLGFFLLAAVRAIALDSGVRQALRRGHVTEVPKRIWTRVEADETLAGVVSDRVLQGSGEHFAVYRDGRLLGFLTANDLRSYPRSEWTRVSADEALTPLGEIPILGPEETQEAALEKMEESGLDYLPVVRDGELKGILLRQDLLRSASLRLEFEEVQP